MNAKVDMTTTDFDENTYRNDKSVVIEMRIVLQVLHANARLFRWNLNKRQ